MADSGDTREDQDADRDEREEEPRDEEESSSGDDEGSSGGDEESSSGDEEESGSSDDDEPESEHEAAERAKERYEKAQQKMEELEEMDEPPVNLEDWPEDQAKYVTFGGPEGEHSYSEGPEEKLGKADLERKADGSVLIEGEEVDNPEELQAEPVAGGPTDPDTAALPGEQRKLDKMRDQGMEVPQAALKAQEQRKERGTDGGDDDESDEEGDSESDDEGDSQSGDEGDSNSAEKVDSESDEKKRSDGGEG